MTSATKFEEMSIFKWYAALFHRFRHHAKSTDDIEDTILALDASIGRQLENDGLDRGSVKVDIGILKSPTEGA